MNKLTNIWLIFLLLLPSCSLFSETPGRVVEGQRGVYQGLLLTEEHILSILKRYEEDNKAAVTYHINYVYEPKIDEIRRRPELSREEKSARIADLEAKRDSEIGEVFSQIEKNVAEMRDLPLKNIDITKRLTESVYRYMSTSPIQVDNVDFWVERLKHVYESN